MKIFDRHGTYHKDVYLPDHLVLAVMKMPTRKLLYGPHSLRAAVEDYRGSVLSSLPVDIRYHEWEIVEVTMAGPRLVKTLVRKRLNDGRWLCLVVNPDGFVRTLWTNHPNDEHRTLDKSRYVQPPQQKSPPEGRAVCWARPSETGHE